MTKEEILSNLCYYDKRNPECIFDDNEIKDHTDRNSKRGKLCACDSCFYGKTKLANELLKYIK